MKKKLPITTFIISIIILVLGYFAYSKFIRPILANNQFETVQINLHDSTEIVFKKQPNQKNIFTFEFEVIGVSDENLQFILMDSLHIPIEHIRIKKGVVDYIHQCDWYSGTAILKTISSNKTTGNLNIKYRFIGLN